MNHFFRFLVAALLSLAVPLAGLDACTKTAEGAHRYHCPMHPTYVSDKPGDCPICGMRLVPIDAAPHASSATGPSAPHPEHEPQGPSTQADPSAPRATTADTSVPGLVPIDVDAEGLRLAGVRTQAAVAGKIARTIRAVGVVRADETRVRHVHTKISGWIERLFVSSTGEPVTAGRPILSIYSQELLAAQYEYLQAKKTAGTMQSSDLGVLREGADDLSSAARRRLELLDVPKSLIAALDRGGEPSRTVTVTSPVGGVVTNKNAFEGQQVEPGMELFTVTDLSRIWIEADLFESEASLVHVGQEGRISFPNDPGAGLTGRIKYVYPYLNAETRTLRVRFAFPNPGSKLKLDSYANVELPVETDQGAIIEDSAILDTGLRQIVFVNTTGGHFEPRQVKVGIRSEGRAQILSGVTPGERVAVKANFLLDSESRLRAALTAHDGTHR